MKRDEMEKRQFFLVAYVVIVLLTAIAGLSFVTSYFGKGSQISKPTTYDKYYVIITDNHDSDFWQAVYEGASDYGLANNVYVEDLAASFSDSYTKEELMSIAIASRVDGIMLSADESEEMTNLINEAVSKNIPVITLYNDSSSSKRISYVGVGNYNVGKEYGKQAISIAKGLSTTEDFDVVVLVSSSPTSSQMMIYSGIQETMEQDDLSTRLNLNTVKIDDTNTFTIEESIRDLFMDENVPDIIICLNELDTTCVYQAVVDYNKVGEVGILGFYDSEAILTGIDKNIINSTIRIDTKQMGEYCVDALLEYDKKGFTSEYFAVDIEVITVTNVRSHMEVEDD